MSPPLKRRAGGAVTQAGMHVRSYQPRADGGAYGLYLGVVLRTYYADDDQVNRRIIPGQLVCDVVCPRYGTLNVVPVAQHGSSFTNGSMWVPQPCTSNVVEGGAAAIANDGQNAAPNIDELDGERVLIGFENGNRARPWIMGSAQHPLTSRPQNGKTLREIPGPTEDGSRAPGPDGNERWAAHQGSVVRLDRRGNLAVNTRGAGVGNDGKTDVSEDQVSGHIDLDVKAGAQVVIRFAGSPVFRLRVDGDGGVVFDLGEEASQRAVLGERLQSLYDVHGHMLIEVPPHTHAAAGGNHPVSGTPQTGPVLDVITGQPSLVLAAKTGAPTPESTIAAAQANPATAVLSERVHLPGTSG